MITQVELKKNDLVKTDWIKSSSKIRIGATVKINDEFWKITNIYSTLDDKEVHFSRDSKDPFQSIDCFDCF